MQIKHYSQKPGAEQKPWVAPSAEPKGEFIKKYTVNYTDLAKKSKLDPVVGRSEEIRRTIEVLSRRRKNNPVLIGDPGTGKSALAEGIAIRIVDGDVPESMKNKQLLALDLGLVMAGTQYRGEFEERFKEIIQTVVEDESIILFIDEIHQLVGMGATSGAMDASNLLKPYLARGELRCIGATTKDEYRKFIEKDKALERRFQPILIGEPTVEETISILRGLKEKYEIHHGVRINDSALVSAAVNSNRYITDRFLPDKAIDIIDEAASRLRLQQESKPEIIEKLDREIIILKIEVEALRKEHDLFSKEKMEKVQQILKEKEAHSEKLTAKWEDEKKRIEKVKKLKLEIDKLNSQLQMAQRRGDLGLASEIMYGKLPNLQKQLPNENSGFVIDEAKMLNDSVTEEDVAKVISRHTGIPLEKLLTGEKEKLIRMEETLSKEVIGQSQAVKAISNCIRISRAGLQSHNRPLGVFLFLGPTGVGKTQLCKSLNKFMFNDSHNIVRIDMAEFSEKFAVTRLIGSPPGYVGYEEGGQLTEAVRRRPYTVILLDEFEKSHPEVSNLMLSLFDEGRLTDSTGRTVDFKNTVIVMTSNLGGEILANLPENVSSESVRKDVMSIVKHRFPPEFLNRIDEVVLFNRLQKQDMFGILDNQLKEIKDLLSERNSSLKLSDKAKVFLVDHGFDPSYGARPLKRSVYHFLLTPLSHYILTQNVPYGSLIEVDLANEGDEKLFIKHSPLLNDSKDSVQNN